MSVLSDHWGPYETTTTTVTGTSKKATGLVSKTNLCTYIMLSCTFLCRSRTTTLSLLENGNSKAINSTMFFWTRARAPLFNSHLNSLLLSSRATCDHRAIVWEGRFQRRFHGRRRCRIQGSYSRLRNPSVLLGHVVFETLAINNRVAKSFRVDCMRIFWLAKEMFLFTTLLS